MEIAILTNGMWKIGFGSVGQLFRKFRLY